MALFGADGEMIMRGNFGAVFAWVDGVGLAAHEISVDGVFDEGCGVLAAEKLFGVGFVFGEEERGLAVAIEIAVAESRFRGADNGRRRGDGLEGRAGDILFP